MGRGRGIKLDHIVTSLYIVCYVDILGLNCLISRLSSQKSIGKSFRIPNKVTVSFQECERMNILTSEMRRSLKELDLGLKGELTITNEMEELSQALFFDQVPESWAKRAYASLHGLSGWYADLILRIKELESWTSDFR